MRVARLVSPAGALLRDVVKKVLAGRGTLHHIDVAVAALVEVQQLDDPGHGLDTDQQLQLQRHAPPVEDSPLGHLILGHMLDGHLAETILLVEEEMLVGLLRVRQSALTVTQSAVVVHIIVLTTTFYYYYQCFIVQVNVFAFTFRN